LVLIGAQFPGFKTTLSENGLSYLRTVGINLLNKFIGTLAIPNLSGEAKTPVGKIDWDLSEIHLDSFAVGSSNAQIVPNSGILLSLSGVYSHVGLNWHYKEKSWPHISDHGSADIDVDVSATVSLQITTSNGRPVLKVASDSVDVTSLKIHLHGGASWLYDLFVNIFSHDIKNAISKALTEAISQNIDQGLNKALSTLPISEPIGPHQDAVINFELIGNPQFTSNYMTVPELGEFYQHSNPQECPSSICPRSQTPDILTSQMLQMIITDFVGNSAGFTFFNLGKLVLKVTDKEIPSWSPIRLNTSSFKELLPALYNDYPNDLLQLNIYSTQPPHAVFTSQGISVLASGNLEMMVVLSNGDLVSAFTLSGWAQTSGTASLSGQTLSGSLVYLKGNFTLLSSQIGPFDVGLFDDLLNLLFSHGIIPAVNTILKKGFELPTIKGLTFINPSIGFGQNFIYVSTDVQYTPPLEDKEENSLVQLQIPINN